jgi:hypothetical protein
MACSNVIAFFMILDTETVLHAHGITDIQTGAQAAEALRPLARKLAFLLFSLGIIGTVLIAIPVLVGSARVRWLRLSNGRSGSIVPSVMRGDSTEFQVVLRCSGSGGILSESIRSRRFSGAP